MKKILLALIVSVTGVSAFAQDTVYSSSGRPVSDYRKRQKEEDKKFDKSKLIFGGGFTLNAGNGFFVGGLSPIVGYKISDKFSAGIGLSYLYYYEKMFFESSSNKVYEYKFKTSVYSGSLWGRYLIWDNIFAHVEPQVVSREVVQVGSAYIDQNDNVQFARERLWTPCVLVGAGIRQPITDRLSIVGLILYDVLQDPNSPYRRSLDIRFGVNVGF